MKIIFESDEFLIKLSDTKLEVDLKGGAKAYLENLFEGNRFYGAMKWILSYIFPRDFYLDDIVDVDYEDGAVIVKEKSPFGVKETRISGLSDIQAEVLYKSLKSMLVKSGLDLLVK